MRGTLGLYTTSGQAVSDEVVAIYNTQTEQLIGPTGDPLCYAPGFAAVPAAVRTSLGLSGCAAASASGGRTTTTARPSPSSAAGTGLRAFAGTWQAHGELVVITDRGIGRLRYADLTKCPACSLATAPVGNVTFTLVAAGAEAATGRVRASSDAKNVAVGAPVRATIVAGRPGHLLHLSFAGESQLPFCDASSAGQCGA